ncbi:MAG: adenosylmethionine--8-amino-7-oxononanoate transaminase [Candidatus Hinthialibacter antarcticus]|nr:adenosylmethionine--8-amino-7-oxononanoate transaminase [Candidatus Hinthialibacter antarcticus]
MTKSIDPTTLVAWDQQYVWHPFTQMQDYANEPPLIVERGEGAYLYDAEGRKYFDGNSSLWVNLHGHARPEINQAMHDQAQRIAHSTLLGPSNAPAIELAKRLVDATPEGLSKVFYSDNGSTSVEVALKMAFQSWRQTKTPDMERCSFITFEEAYHGDTIGSVSVGGMDLFHGIFGPLLFKTYRAPYPVYSKYANPEGPQAVCQQALDACEAVLKAHAAKCAAVIIEPVVQGASGIRTQAPGFLKGLRALCDQYNILLICDEVFVGFGRTGKMFGCQHEGVTPDLLCLAKGITGGYLPLAATLATDAIYEKFLGGYSEFKTFFHGHSYTGNQMGCAAALASLDLFEKDNSLEAMQPSVERLQTRLDRLYGANDHIADIHSIGLIAGIDIAQSRAKNMAYAIEQKMGAQVCFAMRKRGVWLRPLGNTLVVIPPLITQPHEIDFLFDALDGSLAEVLEGE